MKKVFFLLCALLLGAGILQANPVDLEKAKAIGKLFATSRFQTRNAELSLAYTGSDNQGTSHFYAFNVGENGFVIVSADDFYRPIVGYSDEGKFETENMSPELVYYLDNIVKGRQQANRKKQNAEVATEWSMVCHNGRLISRNGGKSATHLVQTKWNQDNPYNKFCPEGHGGPGGRAYAGCVATAMAQVMKYWNHPVKGTGSHSYTPYGGWGSYPSYPTQTANFGETTYDWENMPQRINNGSPEEEINAVALLMYHCGVAVEMMYGPNGSGAYSFDVPSAVINYFSYSDHTILRSRYEYSLTQWQNMLKETFDMGWPVYYSGQSDNGGHAFVCDGYDDNDMFHFNWGWGGSNDGWFVVDEITYSGDAAAIFNFVPKNVYNYTALAPTDFTVTPNGDDEFSATLSWTNPTMTTNNTTLPDIEKVVIMRDGKIIHETEAAVPGNAMSFIDHEGLPTSVSYTIYAVCKGVNGRTVGVSNVNLGPTCPWTIATTSSASNGWQEGKLIFYNSAGAPIGEVTANSSGTDSKSIDMPKGRITFAWEAPQTNIDIAFSITDSENNTVFSFNGKSDEMPTGVFYEANNTCGGDGICNAPYITGITKNGDDVVITWTPGSMDENGFNIYRDGRLLNMVRHATSFTDDGAGDENHCYFITAFCTSGESEPSNECCTAAASACESPRNLRYEMLDNGRIKLYWERPASENLTGYMIYRKKTGENYKRIKLVNASGTDITDSSILPDGARYQYQVTAYYRDADCESEPALALDNPNLNYVEVNKTIIPSHLTVQINESNNILLKWNPAECAASFNIYRNGERIATGCTENSYVDVSPSSDWNCYTVKGVSGAVESSPSNTACTSLTSIQESERPLSIYPNPSTGMVHIVAKGQKEIFVFNLVGQEVIRIVSDSNDVTINLTHLPDGTYFIKTISESGSNMSKIIIRK